MTAKLKKLLTDRAGGIDEETVARALWRWLSAQARTRGVEETPTCVMREDDVVIHYLLVWRIEQYLGLGRNPPSLAEKAVPDSKFEVPWMEALGKARERLRKSVKDFEEYCQQTGTPTDLGVADAVRPLLRKAGNALDEILAVQREENPETSDEDGE